MNTFGPFQNYPSIKQSFGLLGFVILFTLLISLVAIAMSALISTSTNGIAGQSFLTNSWTSLFLYSIPFLLTLWWGITQKKRKEPEYSYRFRPVPLLQAGLIIISTLCIYFIIDPLVELLPMPEFIEKMFMELLSKRNLPTFLLLVIAAPILEEMLCRGIILDGFLKIYNPGKAIIWSAVIFGLMHLNPWQFISAFGLGLYMGWLYHTTGSLSSTILVHAIANGFSFLVALFYPYEFKSTRDLVGNHYIYFAILAVCIGLLFWSTHLIKRMYRKD